MPCPRKRKSELGCRVALVLALAWGTGGAVRGLSAAETNFSKIPWGAIAEWAASNPEKTKNPAPNKSAKPSGSKKPKPPPARPTWTRPGATARRKAPPQCLALMAKVPSILQAKIKNYIRTKNYRAAVDFCFRVESYDRALYFLKTKLMTDPAYVRNPGQLSWMSGQFWRIGIMANRRPPQAMLDGAYGKWVKLLNKPKKDPRWDAWFKTEQDYYKNARNLKRELRDLDFKGDTDPKALWALGQRLWSNHPVAEVRQICTYYKLREWFPDYSLVRSGEVQYRLVNRLYHGLHFNEDGVREAALMRRKWPQHSRVKNGEVVWLHAEFLRGYGFDIPRNKAFVPWKEARLVFLEYQRKYPKAPYNLPQPKTNPPRSLAQIRVGELTQRLGSHK